MAINSTSSATSGASALFGSASRITGLMSTLDTDMLVKNLTSAAQLKIDAVKRRQIRQEWYNEALQSVRNEINEFLNTYVSATGSFSMLKSSSYATYKAVTSSTANAVTVTASGTAEVGEITVKIQSLAQNASVSSSGKVSKKGTEISANNTVTLDKLDLATPLKFDANGKISFSINGKVFEFSKDTTLQNMINTINTDETAGVTMKYSRLTDTFTITADSGGANSSVTIQNISGNAFGSNSAFKIGTGTFTEGRSNAVAVINGVTVTRDTNDFTIDNINYSLKKVTVGTDEETVSLQLERDYSATVESVKKFVDGYNKLYEKLRALLTEKDYSSKYPPLTDAQKREMKDDEIAAWEKRAKSGLLRRSTELESLLSSMRNAFSAALGGFSKNASHIGLKIAGYYDENPGSIVLDEAALTEALKKNADEVIGMFTNGSSTAPSGQQGLMYKLRSSMTTFTTNIKEILKSGETKIKSYDEEIDKLELKLDDLAERYYKKFANMETALAKLNSQASYISQMFNYG
jgi:flagellar hook-associated protein 2